MILGLLWYENLLGNAFHIPMLLKVKADGSNSVEEGAECQGMIRR